MESLDYLKIQLRDAKEELERITIKKHGSVPWNPGVLDQYKSESFEYEEYTDVSKAYRLKDRIVNLENQIKTYAQIAQVEREKEQAIRDSQIPRYEYTSVGKTQTSTNPAIAARYNAQHRLFGMNKLKQSIMTLSGQKRKFKKLWIKANATNKKTQEQVAFELNKMFR